MFDGNPSCSVRFAVAPVGFLIGWGMNMNALGRPWPSPQTGLGRGLDELCVCPWSFLRDVAEEQSMLDAKLQETGEKERLKECPWRALGEPFGYPLVLWVFEIF